MHGSSLYVCIPQVLKLQAAIKHGEEDYVNARVSENEMQKSVYAVCTSLCVTGASCVFQSLMEQLPATDPETICNMGCIMFKASIYIYRYIYIECMYVHLSWNSVHMCSKFWQLV